MNHTENNSVFNFDENMLGELLIDDTYDDTRRSTSEIKNYQN